MQNGRIRDHLREASLAGHESLAGSRHHQRSEISSPRQGFRGRQDQNPPDSLPTGFHQDATAPPHRTQMANQCGVKVLSNQVDHIKYVVV